MIVDEKLNNVSKSHDFKSTKFSIEANGFAFRALTTNLYSDKVSAIIRELSTNAADSHVVAGQTKPFLVHLPNNFEEYFSIRDYGTGISPEKIEDVYTVCFASDKRESNDLTGFLGLGSKSPFHFVDSFTITSYVDGQKYIYNAYLDESGCPTIDLISELETDEENGIEIYIPVNSDYNQWLTKARRIYQYFKQRPIIEGQTVEFNDNIGLSGSGWIWNNTRDGGINYAVMGNVAYPINHSSFGGFKCFDVNFNLGDLNVNIGRESLVYDEKTIKSLVQKAAQINRELARIFNKELSRQPNYWDAVSYCNSINIQNPLYKFSSSQPKWRNRKVPESGFLKVNKEKLGIELYSFEYTYHKVKCVKKDVKSIYPSKNSTIVLVDCKQYNSRCKKFCEDNKDAVVTCVLFNDGQYCKKTARALSAVLGIPFNRFKLASQLDKPPVIRYQRSEKEKNERGVWVFNKNSYITSWGQKSNGWTYTTKDCTDDAYYLGYEKSQAIINGKHLNNYYLKELLCNIETVYGKIDKPIYFVGERVLKKEHGWIPFEEFLKKKKFSRIKLKLEGGSDDLEKYILTGKLFNIANENIDYCHRYKQSKYLSEISRIESYFSLGIDEIKIPPYNKEFAKYPCLLLPIDFENLTTENLKYIKSLIKEESYNG